MGKKEKQTSTSYYRRRLLITYYITVAAVITSSFFPEYRTWGINQWTYFSPIARFLFLSIALLFPLTLPILTRELRTSFFEKAQTYLAQDKNYFRLSLVITSVMTLAFYFLRAKTHFLGDGYLNLASLSSDNPLVKGTAFGEAKAHIWLKSLLGGNNEATALLSFQIISILSGVVLVVSVLFLSRKLFENRLDSMLFSLGVFSGGYILLFFGYVEYYSLFVISVAIFTMIGLLIAKGKLNKWIIMPPLVLAISFHILGITLIPGALILLFSGTKVGNFFSTFSKKTKWLLAMLGGITLLCVFYYFYTTNYRFRFAVLPLFSDQFTVEGYTLFSLNHMADFANLLFLLVPGLLVFLSIFLEPSIKVDSDKRSLQFLFALIISTLGAVFLLDPKLGMHRDWDLLSFSGIPLTAFVFYMTLKAGKKPWKYAVIALMISLGFLSLIPRALRQSIPNAAIAEFKSYAALDPIKNRVGRNTLIDYLKKIGQPTRASNETEEWYKDYPERAMLLKADSLLRMNRTTQGIQFLKQVLKRNPYYPPAYYALGRGYVDLNQADSAVLYLEIANAMNPNSRDFLYFLGLAHKAKGNFDKAEDAFKAFMRVDDKTLEPRLALLELYAANDRNEEYNSLLTKVAQREDAPTNILVEYGVYLINNGEEKNGYDYLKKAISKGLDSTQTRQLENTYPKLKNY